MSAPFILVSTFKVKEGSLEDLREYYRTITELIMANEPRFIAFHGYVSDDGTEMASIQIHPDVASMEFHLQVLRDNWDETFSQYASVVEGVRIDYYGAMPPEAAVELSRQAGSEVAIKPVHLAGFTRAASN